LRDHKDIDMEGRNRWARYSMTQRPPNDPPSETTE
jgi:hypothetical protein